MTLYYIFLCLLFLVIMFNYVFPHMFITITMISVYMFVNSKICIPESFYNFVWHCLTSINNGLSNVFDQIENKIRKDERVDNIFVKIEKYFNKQFAYVNVLKMMLKMKQNKQFMLNNNNNRQRNKQFVLNNKNRQSVKNIIDKINKMKKID